MVIPLCGEGYDEYLQANTIILNGVIKAEDNIEPFEMALKYFNDISSSPMRLEQVINISASKEALIARQQSRVKKAIEAGQEPQPDDDLATKRLEAYFEHTQGVIDYYKKSKNYSDVDSSKSLENTTADLLAIITPLLTTSTLPNP